MVANDMIAVDGRVERVQDGVIEGWAWNPEDPTERVTLRVFVDGVETGTAVAELARPSLAAAGIGDGAHAFQFELPQRVAERGRHLLRIAAGDEALAPAKGFSVGVADENSAWSGVWFAVDHPDAPTTGRPATDGRVEQVHDGVVEGWAWSPAWPHERVEVRVILDGEAVGTTVAELARPSLAAAGIGDGAHAFQFELPAGRAHAGRRTLRVETPGGALDPASGFTSEDGRSDGPWYGATFSVGPLETVGARILGNGAVPRAPTSPADAAPDGVAVVGGGGWLYDAQVLAALSPNARASTEANIAVLLDALDQLDSRVSEGNARLLPVLLPIKELVYREQLPQPARTATATRPGDLILRGLSDHQTLDALDLMPALQAGAERYPVFSPTTGVMTEWGVYSAYRAVVKRAAMILPGVPPPVELDGGALRTAPPQPWRGRLAVATESGLVRCLPDQLPDPPSEPVVVAPTGGAKHTPHEHLARLKTNFARGWEQPTDENLGRCLFVGDPVHEMLAEWTARHFRFTVLIGADSPVIDLTALECPDVIVYLVNERALLMTPSDHAGGDDGTGHIAPT